MDFRLRPLIWICLPSDNSDTVPSFSPLAFVFDFVLWVFCGKSFELHTSGLRSLHFGSIVTLARGWNVGKKIVPT